MSTNMQQFPQAVLDACRANLRKVATKYGTTTQGIIATTNPGGDSPEASCNILNVVALGKRTLGIPLTDVETGFLAASAFITQVNGSGLESFIECPEADDWPALRKVLEAGPQQDLEHFDRLMNLLGTPFSTNHQDRVAKWRQSMSAMESEMDQLAAEYDELEYPTLATIEKYMAENDTVVISDDVLKNL